MQQEREHFFIGLLLMDGCLICLNGTILTLCTILKCVTASVAEAELGALFLNTIVAEIMCLTLDELGHLQPLMPIYCNNTMVMEIIHGLLK